MSPHQAKLLALAVFYTLCIMGAHGVHSESGPEGNQQRQPDLHEMVNINGKEYAFGNASLSWYFSEYACRQLNMTLLTLDTQDKSGFFISWLLQNPEYDVLSWTSGRREAGATEFIWTATRELFNYTAWAPGEPTAPTFYPTCMDFSGSLGGWEDNNCGGLLFSYICEDLFAE